MKAIHLHRPMVRPASNPRLNVLQLQESRPVPASGSKVDTDSKLTNQLAGVTTSLVTGFFALWLSLTILGSIGLRSIDNQFLHSLGLRIAIASGLALGVCIIALPFILPWFLAFLPAYFLIPRRSVFRKLWVCTVSGVIVGILALWIDAVVYCLSTGEPVSSLNISLLRMASIPAAALGAAICFSAAGTEESSSRMPALASKRSQHGEQRNRGK